MSKEAPRLTLEQLKSQPEKIDKAVERISTVGTPSGPARYNIERRIEAKRQDGTYDVGLST